MHYPTVRDVGHIIKGKEFYGTDTAIMNRGQLEFILDKPRMVLYGKEQYPELYQKAAALMEAVCKAHVLGDGNKSVERRSNTSNAIAGKSPKTVSVCTSLLPPMQRTDTRRKR